MSQKPPLFLKLFFFKQNKKQKNKKKINLYGCLAVNVRLLLWGQPCSPYVNHCVFFQFLIWGSTGGSQRGLVPKSIRAHGGLWMRNLPIRSKHLKWLGHSHSLCTMILSILVSNLTEHNTNLLMKLESKERKRRLL